MMDTARKNIFSFDGKIDELTDDSIIIYHGPTTEAKYKTYYENQQISYQEIPELMKFNHNKTYTDKMLGILVTNDYRGQFVVIPDENRGEERNGKTDHTIKLGVNFMGPMLMDKLFELCDQNDNSAIIEKIEEILDRFEISIDPFKEFELLVLKSFHLFAVDNLEESLALIDLAEEKYNSYPQRQKGRINRARIDRINGDPEKLWDRGHLKFDYGFLYFFRGFNYHRLQNSDSALDYYDQAFEIWEMDKHDHYYDLMNVNSNSAIILKNRGLYDEAEKHYKEAYIYSKKANFDQSYEVLINLALLYRYTRQFDKAIETIDRAQDEIKDLDIAVEEKMWFYNTMGMIYQNKEIVQSTKYFNKSYMMIGTDTNPTLATLVLYHLCINTINLEKYELTKMYFSKLKNYSHHDKPLVSTKIEVIEHILALEEIKDTPEKGFADLVNMIFDDSINIVFRIEAILFVLKHRHRFVSNKLSDVSNLMYNEADVVHKIEEIVDSHKLYSLENVIKNYPDVSDESIERLISYQLPLAEI